MFPCTRLAVHTDSHTHAQPVGLPELDHSASESGAALIGGSVCMYAHSQQANVVPSGGAVAAAAAAAVADVK